MFRFSLTECTGINIRILICEKQNIFICKKMLKILNQNAWTALLIKKKVGLNNKIFAHNSIRIKYCTSEPSHRENSVLEKEFSR